ncbi:MAG: methyltransferase domain-containing protein [Thalassobaculum sp.]|uniref:class I SAM-dependent methyltransferase n=1 Tax=Thalassobaculum sp. TaxID=2022740 RepID=UPI0032EAF078
MAEVNLLARLPKSKRNVKAREHAKTDEHIRVSREYGEMYFDGPREYGYGGYRYDGRWVPIAEDMIAHFGLKPGMRVLDVGAAKGFLVKDFMIACPGLEAFGLEISEYALKHCEPEVVGRLHLGNAVSLPFPDHSFDAVISLNTLHNLERPQLITALQEIMRVTKGGKAFVQVDSYRNEEERAIFLDWVLTAHTHDYPDGWLKLFDEAGYTGDYFWTLIS